MPFNSRFYVIALIFLLFDVEMVFILPWATVFGDKSIIAMDNRWGWLSLMEMFVFLGILVLGLIYVWAKGDLDWIKPKPVIPTTDTRVPGSLYDQLNKQQSAYKVKDFALEHTAAAPEQTATATATPIRKPMFKPTFKKPENES
jgi:NADH-quinone oxidoreductase subunit A